MLKIFANGPRRIALRILFALAVIAALPATAAA
jgi:hypothetical protein